jgi:hypothetical protein
MSGGRADPADPTGFAHLLLTRTAGHRRTSPDKTLIGRGCRRREKTTLFTGDFAGNRRGKQGLVDCPRRVSERLAV